MSRRAQRMTANAQVRQEVRMANRGFGEQMEVPKVVEIVVEKKPKPSQVIENIEDTDEEQETAEGTVDKGLEAVVESGKSEEAKTGNKKNPVKIVV